MKRLEQIEYLNGILLEEMPDWKRQAAAFPQDETARRRLLRSLMNVRPPMPLKPEFLDVQDALLSAEREERGVVDADALPAVAANPRLVLWQGDITRLRRTPLSTRPTARCSAALLPAMTASITPFTRRPGCSCATNAAA